MTGHVGGFTATSGNWTGHSGGVAADGVSSGGYGSTSYGDVPVSTLIAGGGGTAAGLYAYGASNHKIMCGSVGYVVGAGLALASPLCGTDYMKHAQRGER